MPSLTSALDRLATLASASHARACVLLVLLSLAAFLPGFQTLQPLDRDEPRFAQASKQMLETRDFVDIRFQDEARHKKPVGIYWLQSATVAAGEALGVPQARTKRKNEENCAHRRRGPQNIRKSEGNGRAPFFASPKRGFHKENLKKTWFSTPKTWFS